MMSAKIRHFSGKTLPPHLNTWRVICLYGDDNGLISQRAQTIVKDIVGKSEDPFQTVILDKQDHEKLESEYSSISMLGGQRVIRVREVGEDIRKKLQQALTHKSDNILVLQTQNIVAPSRSSLCRFLGKQDGCALVKCYKETGYSLENTIRQTLAKHNVKMDKDATQFFLNRIDADNAIIRSELEKLLLYVHPAKEITIEDIRQSIGDSGVGRLDDVGYEALNGEVKAVTTSLSRVYLAGQNSISVIRTILGYMQRLQRIKAQQENGEPLPTLLKSIYFMRRKCVANTLRRWSFSQLTHEIERMQDLEMSCKQTGAPAEALCRQHVLLLAIRASKK